ncbi:hypothetical protein C9374_012911 [Naegleria lovaniensis]|uniref:Uncharacterized protein n=1 Tax=Naegleria lovaniensis TaxID=51637 RepID=A0AA88G6P5_NAELO|nr:uncharacterized protein C9374_012911 [Naegleria lovaniensis]KAG2373065.1 hypothetical protein C9374_012911 [Naegleria lovaniensis]
MDFNQFDTEFSTLLSEVVTNLPNVDMVTVDPLAPCQPGKIPFSRIDSTLLSASYKLRDPSVNSYQKIIFLNSIMMNHCEIVFLLFGGDPRHPGYLPPSTLWSILKENLCVPKNQASMMDGRLSTFHIMYTLLGFSVDRMLFYFPDVIFDLLLLHPNFSLSESLTSNNTSSDMMIMSRIYDTPNAVGLAVSMSQNLTSWYQGALEDRQGKAKYFDCNIETFELMLDLLRDRLFMFIVACIKCTEKDRLMVVCFLDNLCDLFGTMRVNEREEFVFDQQKSVNSFNSQVSSLDSSKEGSSTKLGKILNALYMTEAYDRQEYVEYLVDTFSNHSSKKIRDSITSFLGLNLIRKVKQKIQQKKLNKLRLNSKLAKDASIEEYFTIVCELGGRKRKFRVSNVNSIAELQDKITQEYSQRKRSSQALSTSNDQKNVLQLFLSSESELNPKTENSDHVGQRGDWVDLDDFNYLQASQRNIQTKKVINEVINQVRLVKKVVTKITESSGTSFTDKSSFLSESFVPSRFEDDDSALATKGSSEGNTAQQLSDKSNSSGSLEFSNNTLLSNDGSQLSIGVSILAPQQPIVNQNLQQTSGIEMSGIEMSGIEGSQFMSSLENLSFVDTDHAVFSSDDEDN